MPQWFLDQHRNGMVQQSDMFGGGSRHPVESHATDFLRHSAQTNMYTGRGDVVNQRDDFQMHRDSYNGLTSGQHEKGGGNYDAMPSLLRGGHRPLIHFEGFEPTHGGVQGASVPFEHIGDIAFKRSNDAAEFGMEPMEHSVNVRNRDNEMDIRRLDEYRDSQTLQSEFLPGARKRIWMDGGKDMQGPRDGRFSERNMEREDFLKGQDGTPGKRFSGNEGPLHSLSSEYQHNIQSLNHLPGDRPGAFFLDQTKKDDATSNKRQRVVSSREEELLIEHGLLDDDTDNVNDKPLSSELQLDAKALSPKKGQGFGFPHRGLQNKDDARPTENAFEGKALDQKFQPSKDESILYWNALGKRYPLNLANDSRGSAYTEARDQNRDVPLYLRGSQKDLSQDWSVESGSVWQNKSDNSLPGNERFPVHQPMAAFHASRDSSHMSMQQPTGMSTLPAGGFKEHHFPSGSVIQKYSQLVPQSGREGNCDESLNTIEELHLDFAQKQQRMDKQSYFQSGQFQEEIFRRGDSSLQGRQGQCKDIPFEEAPQQHQQALNWSQIEVQRQGHQTSSQGQDTYTQMQQLQPTQLGEHNYFVDKIESKTGGGQSQSNPYRGRLHHSNIQAHNHWNQPLSHTDAQPDMDLQKNSHPLTPVLNHEYFQHAPSDDIVQEHHLQVHEQQQQRPLQVEQQTRKLHQDISQLQQQEPHLIPNQVYQDISPNQQNQPKLQQHHGSSQMSHPKFEHYFQSKGQQHHPVHQLIHEKQNPQEWGYQFQQQSNQESGKQYPLEVKGSHHHQHNQKVNLHIYEKQNPQEWGYQPQQQSNKEAGQQYPLEVKGSHHHQHNQKINLHMQQEHQMSQFVQKPDLYQHHHGHQQQPEMEQNQVQDQHKSQQMLATECREISHANAQGGHQLSFNGSGVHTGMPITASITKVQIQPSQPSAPVPSAPPLPPPPLPPSPPSSPSHAPPPPPAPVSPPKSSTSTGFSSSTAGTHSLPTSMRSFPDLKTSTHGFPYQHTPVPHGAGFSSVGSHVMHHMPPFKQYVEAGQLFPPKQVQEDKPKVVDAINIFRQPGRATRPDRFVIILRGLPGSGKSYLAKALRDIEVMNGGSAPRIHSMDDYFMTEVEKVEDSETGTALSSLLRSKKRVTKKVMEYCYEPEMEEAYRASMLKAFKKTLEEGIFTFIIVDDRNLRVADFAQFWAVAKRSGYEVYLLEAPYKDPAGCAARNVHNFSADKVQEMADHWEAAPPLYLQLDISTLFRGDDLNAQDITEVEMDTDDVEHGVEDHDESFMTDSGKKDSPSDFSVQVQIGQPNHGDRWGSEISDPSSEVKDLTRSKWSDDHDDDNTNAKEPEKVDGNALSGLMQAYGKGDRCVRWADQGDVGSDKGFSIGCVPQNKRALIIGPGAGYNEVSNPLPEEERNYSMHGSNSGGESKRNTKLLDQLRAEQESFRAVFDRRRHRIGGMEEDDE